MPAGLDPDEWQSWTETAQAEYLSRLKAVDQAKVWYCPIRGRNCDGKPHDEVPYPHARSLQWPPPHSEEYLTWLMLSGRGSGKTRTAAEYVRKMSELMPRIALVAATGPDLREIMIEGESGLEFVCARAGQPGDWAPSRRRFTFANGAVAHGYSAEEPDRLRGPQHHLAWADEPCHWSDVQTVWDTLLLGLRLGRAPKVVATSTPIPIPWVKDLIVDPLTRVTTESTYANIANLAPAFARTVLKRYEGTRLGQQELHGEVLRDIEGALWQTQMFDDTRVSELPEDIVRIVVGVDPAGTSAATSDETGIVVVALDSRGHLYVIADYSGRFTPARWAARAVSAARSHAADAIVAENNYGGQMVTDTLKAESKLMRVISVNSRHGKFIRAEPVEAMYERGMVHHVGVLEELEAQLCTWVPGKGFSPDRMDALVHACHELADDVGGETEIAAPTGLRSRSGQQAMFSRPASTWRERPPKVPDLHTVPQIWSPR